MATPNLNPEWVIKMSIGTAYATSTWTYAPLCAGIESITPSINEQNTQAFYMCGNGGACNTVTGIAPEYDVSGHRVIGDTAQDYIVSKRYKVEIYDGTTLVETIVADCTITDIVDFGGNATDVVPFSCKLRVNGIPTVTAA